MLTIASAVASCLANSLSSLETQENIRPAKRSKSGIYFMGPSPRTTIIFMERYGLPDGLPKSPEELAKKYQLSRTAITQNAANAGGQILTDPAVWQLIKTSI